MSAPVSNTTSSAVPKYTQPTQGLLMLDLEARREFLRTSCELMGELMERYQARPSEVFWVGCRLVTQL